MTDYHGLSDDCYVFGVERVMAKKSGSFADNHSGGSVRGGGMDGLETASAQIRRSSVVALLVIEGGPQMGRRVAVYGGTNSVGRSDDNIIVFPADDRMEDKEHCYIRSTSDGIEVVPNERRSIVAKNNAMVTEPSLLTPEDTLLIGGTTVRLMLPQTKI